MNKALVGITCAFLMFTANAGNVFYWQQGRNWASFDDPANWSLAKDEYSNPDNLIPGESDYIWSGGTLDGGNYWLGYFDMNGKNRTVKGYSSKGGIVNWQSYLINVRNGTLTVLDPTYRADPDNIVNVGHRYWIYDGGRLVYPVMDPESSDALFASGLQEQWTIKSGGTVEAYCRVSLEGSQWKCNMTVEAGGRLVFAPTSWYTASSNSKGVEFLNSGMMELPLGLNWGVKGWTSGVAEDVVTFTLQAGSTTLLGSDVAVTGYANESIPKHLGFNLAGGELVVSNAVAFYTDEQSKAKWGEQVYAAMPDNAMASVRVLADSSIDMSPFVFGALTSLTKSGPGMLTLGATRPAALTVAEGPVTFAAKITGGLADVTLTDGATVVFGAKENELDGLENAANATFTLGDGFVIGDVVATGTDATLLAAVAQNLVIPDAMEDCKVKVVGNAVKLVFSGTAQVRVRALTLYEGDEPANNGFVVVNKKTGEPLPEDSYSGTPVYSYGDYAGSKGTYTVGVSGLSSEDFELEYVPATLTVAPADESLDFYWQGGQVFGTFGEVSNWAHDVAGTVPATRLPGRKDKVWSSGSAFGSSTYGSNYHVGKWDLNGGSECFFCWTDGTGLNPNWKNWWVDLTNGTLTVMEPTYSAAGHAVQAGRLFNVLNGATLVYPVADYGASQLAGSGLMERWEIYAGGTVEAYGTLGFCSADGQPGGVDNFAGGRLVFDPKLLFVSSSNKSGVRFINDGTMICPRGIVWQNTSYCQESRSGTDDMLFLQRSGTMLLGGDVMRTNNYWASNVKMPSRLMLELAGGTVQISNSVGFATSANSYEPHIEKWGEEVAGRYRKQVFPSLSTNADVTVEVLADSSIDMTDFAYGPGAKMTKAGPGKVTFGATLPSELTVNGGTVAFATPTPDTTPSTVAFGPDCTGEFRLRVWKDGDGNVVNDAIDFGDGLVGDFRIKPMCNGFRMSAGDMIRLGDYPDGKDLPVATFADRNWEFCRKAEEPNVLYFRYAPVGLLLHVR